jgi:predicted AAA+ superfamily ATPase
VFRSLRPKGPIDSPEEITGAALEGLVLQHLRAWIDYSDADASLYFWRNRSGNEVDFIIYGDHLFVAIEVKTSQRVKAEHLRGLATFRKDYPECTPLLLYMGTQRLSVNEIPCIPCSDFLPALVPGKTFPFVPPQGT